MLAKPLKSGDDYSRLVQKMGGKTTNPAIYRFGTRDLAAAASKTRGTVKQDRWRGLFDPKDLRSIARYIVASHDRWLRKQAKLLAERDRKRGG